MPTSIPPDASPHLVYTRGRQPYHSAVAGLACKYTGKNGSLLDVGCGTGHTLVEVQRRRPDLRLYAADIDSHCLEVTAKRVTLAEQFLLNDVDDLFSGIAAFETMILSHSLEHMHRPVDAVKGLMQRLCPGGILVLAVPNPLRLPVILHSLRQKHYVNRGHVVAWDRSHWRNFLENILAVSVVEYSQDYCPVPLLSRIPGFHTVETALSRVLPWFSFSHIAVVRKENASLDDGRKPDLQ